MESGSGESSSKGPDCHVCGGPLQVIPDSFPLWLRCDSNHFLTVTELLDLHLPRISDAEAEWTFWQSRIESLRLLAREAMAHRHPVAAAGFEDAARQIRERLNAWPIALSAPRST